MVALLLVTGYALSRGAVWVRLAALANALNWVLESLLQPKHQHAVFAWGDFAVDTAFGLFFIVLAVRSRRVELAMMAAFLLLDVANYASGLTEMRTWHRAFVTASYVWSFGALLTLAVAAWRDGRAILG